MTLDTRKILAKALNRGRRAADREPAATAPQPSHNDKEREFYMRVWRMQMRHGQNLTAEEKAIISAYFVFYRDHGFASAELRAKMEPMLQFRKL